MTRYVSIGRLTLGPPSAAMSEPTGDPVGAIGGATVSAPRTPYQVTVDINTILSGSSTNTDAARVRRQIRSMLNNTPLKMQAFIYFIYSDDLEQNGWLVPGPMALTSPDAVAWKAVGLWQTSSGQWNLVGRMRTMREARQLMIKDTRFALYESDYLGWIISNDFSSPPLQNLPLTVLPNGAFRAVDTVTDQLAVTYPLTAGRDGGACLIVPNLPDLACLSYERPETALNLSDVIAYDRRGQITKPSAGPDTLWEEAYGPDYAWAWVNNTGTPDMPVLDNGKVRVRYDQSAGDPGFAVDVWDVADGYVEQGKMTLWRVGDLAEYSDTWSSASMLEYTPDRAVIQCVLVNSGDVTSYQRVYITVTRGIAGVRFEAYPAPKLDSSQADVAWSWTAALLDDNISVMKSQTRTLPPPMGTALLNATAGTGSVHWTPVDLGIFNASENYVSILRCTAGPYLVGMWQANLSIVQEDLFVNAQPDTSGYGANHNDVAFFSNGNAGYASVFVNFTPTGLSQVLECEFIQGGDGTESVVVDAAASNGEAVADTQAFATQGSTCTLGTAFLPAGTYHLFVRAKTSGTGACEVQMTFNGTIASYAPNFTGTSYSWFDLGEVALPANPSLTLVAGYQSTPATTYVDRIEMFAVSRRGTGSFGTATGTCDGARDAAQSCLCVSNTLGTLTTR